MTNQEKSNDKKFPAGKPRTRKRLTWALGIILLLVICGVGYPFYLHAMSHESTDDAFVEAQVVTISPRIAGHVSRVQITDNQMVKKGDLLVELDSRDQQVALNIAQAKLQSARAALEQAQAQADSARNNLVQQQAALSSQQANLGQAQAQVAEVEASYSRDANDYKRYSKMAKEGAVSRQEYDHAKAAADMTKAQLRSAKRQVDTQSAKIRQARAALKSAHGDLQQTYAEISMRQASVNEAEADVEQARLDLSYTRITAPCDGHVTKKDVEPGNYVAVGQKLFSIVSPETWVVANFKETQITHMLPGQPVEIEVDTYPDTVFHGHVDSIQRGTGSRFTLLPPENATGNYIKVVQRVPVKIVLDDPDDHEGYLLAPGMSVIPSVDISVQTPSTRMTANSEPRKTEAK